MTHHSKPAQPSHADISAKLEVQLAALDRLGAHIAAAHVDAAITQIGRDMTTLQPCAVVS